MEVILHITSLCSFIAYTFKEQVHVFAGRVKIVSHLSCRKSAILKYLCPLVSSSLDLYWLGSCFLACLPDPLPDPCLLLSFIPVRGYGLDHLNVVD